MTAFSTVKPGNPAIVEGGIKDVHQHPAPFFLHRE
jgi:hypothetical protein